MTTDVIQIQGIDFVTAPSPGPIRAGLCFRVGMADEFYGNHGICHLIEHLAFDGMLDPANQMVHANGMTTDIHTSFYIEGTQAEVVDFLNRITANLRELPLHRLDKEKQVLKTEQTRRGGPVAEARNTRHGLQDFGLSGVAELGLNRVGAEEISAWAAKYFTADNVVGFLTTAEAPEGLDLRLPPGTRQLPPAPSLSPAVDPLPRAYAFDTNAVVFESLVPTRGALGMLVRLARARFTVELREVDAISYSISVDTSMVGADTARLTCLADTEPRNGAAVVQSLVDQLVSLGQGHISAEEMERARRALIAETEEGDYAKQLLGDRAIGRLLGTPEETLARYRRRVEAVTVDDVAALARTVRESAFWITPVNDLRWVGLPPAKFLLPVVEGHRFQAINADEAIIVSDKGVTHYRGQAHWTVPYDQCVGVLAYPDGARQVVGVSGVSIGIEPTLYDGLTPALVTALVDPQVNADHMIPMPARREDAIPTAPPPPPQAAIGQPSYAGGLQAAAGAPTNDALGYTNAPVSTFRPGHSTAPSGSTVGYAWGHPQAAMYPNQPGMVQPRPAKRIAARILWVVLAVVFSLCAAFMLLVFLGSLSDTSPEIAEIRPILIGAAVMTGIPAILFIRAATRR
ncbi:MAG: hypothetical protein LBV06_07350 [Propionibacteriaceae bacterium]|jgi:predicted Zn-dependent peptidase|nr:hypothetical protein [Propionibacteriaceae bacterium]